MVKFPHRNLTDIPACLRRMAEQVEAGDIDVTSLIIVSPVDGEWPAIFGFGKDEELDTVRVIGWLELAKSWFVAEVAKETT